MNPRQTFQHHSDPSLCTNHQCWGDRNWPIVWRLTTPSRTDTKERCSSHSLIHYTLTFSSYKSQLLFNIERLHFFAHITYSECSPHFDGPPSFSLSFCALLPCISGAGCSNGVILWRDCLDWRVQNSMVSEHACTSAFGQFASPLFQSTFSFHVYRYRH